MKRSIFSLFFLLAGLAAAMTPEEFTALYEKSGKTAEDCYKLYQAYSEGDGTEKDDAKARKWILAAHGAGMLSTRKEIATLPWRSSCKAKLKPSITVAEVDDATARQLGEELIDLLVEEFNFTGGRGLKDRPAGKATAKKVRELIAAGADLNVWKSTPSLGHYSALFLLTQNMDLKLAKLLIEHGADPCANSSSTLRSAYRSSMQEEDKRYGRPKADNADSSPIPPAELRKMEKRMAKEAKESRENHRKMFAFLLAHGVDISLYTNYGWTQMYEAAMDKSPSGVQMLAKAGLDPNARNNPHEYVQAAGRPDGMQYRFRVGGVKERNHPLFFSIGAHPDPFVVEALLKAGADPNMEDKDGCTPLDYALGEIRSLNSNPEDNPNKPRFMRYYKDMEAALKRAGGKATGKVPESIQYMLDHYSKLKGENAAE